MAKVGDVIVNPVAKMRLEVLQTRESTDGELLEVEASYEPNSNPPLPHLHPSQDEHFEVRSGRMRVRLAGEEERDLVAGDTLDVPRQTVHSMWNPGPDETVLLWQTRPALRTEDFFEALAALMRKADAEPAEGAALMEEYADVFRPAPAGPRG